VGKEIILLAESKKYKNLCIAGVDTSTGEWVRIVSQDSSVSHAVKIEDAIYEDGSVPKLLDIIEIECMGRKLNYYQVENYVYNPDYYWSKTGQATIKDVLKIHPLENKDYIFYNTDKRVHKDYLLGLSDKVKYSLMLIAPTNIKVHVRQWANRKDVTMSFDYRGLRYNYLSITDIDYEQRYLALEPNDYTLKNGTLLVLSLGDCYKKDNCHYKLVVTIIE